MKFEFPWEKSQRLKKEEEERQWTEFCRSAFNRLLETAQVAVSKKQIFGKKLQVLLVPNQDSFYVALSQNSGDHYIAQVDIHINRTNAPIHIFKAPCGPDHNWGLASIKSAEDWLKLIIEKY